MEKEEDLNHIQANNSNHLKDDTSFNKLKELQKLLKKESAVKELFIRMKDETKKSIETQGLEVLKKKIEVLNILQKINTENPINKKKSTLESNKGSGFLKEYVLVENNYKYLSDLNKFISNILKYIWEEPKLIANLLINSDKKNVKMYLAPLICNNFYQNILSPNYIEDPLIYILYLLIKNEIDSLESIEQSDCFLDNTPCSYLLGQLIEQNDVKEFFKIILQNSLEDLGTNKFMFNIGELDEWLQKNKKQINKSVSDKINPDKQNIDEIGKRRNTYQIKLNENKEVFTKSRTLTNNDIKGITEDDNTKNIINYQTFAYEYLTSIPLNELEKHAKNDKNDIWIKNYYEYLILNAKGEKEIYYQNDFTNKMTKANDFESVLSIYQDNFAKVREFIDKLFDNLKNNYRIIPYALKCVCKIIYKLITNKYPNSSLIERSLFISNFFFKTILFPILQKPDINALINNYIISKNTLHNLKIISDILWVLCTFNLYKDKEENNFSNGDFTPFNRYFLGKIPMISEIYKSLIDVNLPKFIDGLIDKSINEDEYCFDFFNENPNDISFYQTILLNIYEFNALFVNLDRNKTDLLEKKETPNEGSKYFNLKTRTEKNKKNILLAIKFSIFI